MGTRRKKLEKAKAEERTWAEKGKQVRRRWDIP